MGSHEEQYEDVSPQQPAYKEYDDVSLPPPDSSVEKHRDRGDRDGRDVDRRSRDGSDRGRSRDADRERDRDSGRRHRDDSDRRREKHSSRDEKDRDRDRDRGDRDRDRDRGRDRDRDRERSRKSREKSRSRSRDRRKSGRSRSRSRSREKTERKAKRQSGFDMAPPGAVNPMTMPGVINSAVSAMAAMPGMGMNLGQPGMPNMFPGMFPMMSTQITQATRHARRVYVGGLPPMANEQSVAAFFSQAMAAIGGNTAGPGDAAVNVYINQEKRFAFVELRTVEEASNAMSLDGIVYEGISVRVRRPSDYNPALAATLGPSSPSPNLNLAAVGLVPGATGGADGPDRIFVGGLPYYLSEEQIKELLSAFGQLRAFDLVKDRDTGNSKGYGFCVYQDPKVTDIACAALNGMKMGDKVLTVRRATASNTQSKPEQSAFPGMQYGTGANTMPLGVPAMAGILPGAPVEVPTRVVALTQVVTPNELVSDEDYEEIMEDMKEECAKYGTLTNLVIPRPGPDGALLPGVGKVFVEYTDTTGAQSAKQALSGRKFGGNSVVAIFYSEEKYARGDYGG